MVIGLLERMDWLLKAEPVLAMEVYASAADLLNLEVDLLFFDTTSTYFQTEPPTTWYGATPPGSAGHRARR